MLHLLSLQAELVDLQGRMLLPGFQDAHVHPVWGGLDMLRCDLAGTPVSGLDYVPLLHSNEDWCTSGWSTNVANAQKNYKVTHVLSFNEPDQCGYVHLTPYHHIIHIANMS